MNAPPGPQTPTPAKERSWSTLALLVAPFALLWVVYLGLRATMPSDDLEPFRSGLYWPDSSDLMLAKGGGITSRVLLHVGFTYGLGLVLLIGLVVVRGIFTKRESKSRVGTFICFALAFLLMLGVSTVPNRVTRIDEKQGITVTHMIPVPPWTMSTEELATKDVRALGARLGVRGTKWKERVVRIYALSAKGEPLELGEAECPGADDECLEWADPAAEQIAEKLGWEGKLRVSKEDGGKLRQYAVRE